MGTRRPGTTIRFWNPRFTNQPDIGPPLLLRLVSGLAILSVVGTLLFAVFTTLSAVGVADLTSTQSLYVAVLHFVLPLVAAYTISNNYPISRLVVVVYSVMLTAATLLGIGLLGQLARQQPIIAVGVPAMFTALVFWLYLGRRPTVYYRLIAGKSVPDELRDVAESLREDKWLNPRVRDRMNRLLDKLEIITMVSFIVIVLLAVIFIGDVDF